MSWNCRVVKEVGRTYSVVWCSDEANCVNGHYHRTEQPISKEDYDSSDKYHKFDNVSVRCDRCAESFQSRSGFGSKPIWDTEDGKVHVGDMYHSNHGGFSDWWVVLPGGTRFNIHRKSTSDGKPWDVSGDPPNITLRPSIVIPREWHGYITNGVISDDLEGRKYD